MFRFVCNTARVTAMAARLVRFQSSSVVGESAAAARSNNNSNNNRRNWVSTMQLPRFEIHDVRDTAAQGSMTRVAVDGKQLLVSQFPQLGPRKADPNDTTPQFDRDRRVSLRFRHMDLAALVCVVEGHQPSHHMANSAYELEFEKTPSGYVLKGQVQRSPSQVKEEWSVRFENQFAVTLEHFLQGALTESFGFAEHRHAMEAQAAQKDNTSGNANNNNNNNSNQNRRRNNNNRNRRNNKNNIAEESEKQAAPAAESS
uniref:Guide RNA-binding protein gBP29 n=1 Tax=Crithidia fasciculata TaxID=5656 RepID=Q9NDH5_CRIFA|nr:guide RNA-binding protein gBP29 [Crithidia fasciculata]